MTTDGCTFSSCSSTSHKTSTARPRSYELQEADWNEPSSAVCHRIGARPARERRSSLDQNRCSGTISRPWRSMHSCLFVVLLSVLLCCQQVEAGNLHGSRRLERKAELLFDRRASPEPRMRIRPRKEASDGAPKVHTLESTLVNNGLITADQGSQIPLPNPFDTSIGNNFTTSSCPTFFNSFLTNETFNACLPLSLLLQVCSR